MGISALWKKPTNMLFPKKSQGGGKLAKIWYPEPNLKFNIWRCLLKKKGGAEGQKDFWIGGGGGGPWSEKSAGLPRDFFCPGGRGKFTGPPPPTPQQGRINQPKKNLFCGKKNKPTLGRGGCNSVVPSSGPLTWGNKGPERAPDRPQAGGGGGDSVAFSTGPFFWWGDPKTKTGGGGGKTPWGVLQPHRKNPFQWGGEGSTQAYRKRGSIYCLHAGGLFQFRQPGGPTYLRGTWERL